MHVRLSSIRGMTILDDQTQTIVGCLHDALIHPDTGKIEGFFVFGSLPEYPLDLFLSSSDIVAWGTHLHVRSFDRLSPPSELVRLQELIHDPRTVLGEPVRVRGSRKRIGTCRDVQFDTRHLRVEWIFPYSWYFVQQRPVAASEIEEITTEAIWISDPLCSLKERVSAPRSEKLPMTMRDEPLAARA